MNEHRKGSQANQRHTNYSGAVSFCTEDTAAFQSSNNDN